MARAPMVAGFIAAGIAVAVFVATVGDEITVVASTLDLARADSSVAGVSALMVAVTVPSILLAPWIGRFVDRHSPRVTVSLPVAVAGLIVLALGLVRSLPLTMMLIGALGVMAAIVGSSIVAAIPVVTERTRWNTTQASAALEVVRSSSFLIAPPIAGLLVATLDYRTTLFVVCAAYLVAAGVFVASFVHTSSTEDPDSRPEADSETTESPHLLVGFHDLFAAKEMRLPLFAVAAAVTGSAVFDVLLVFFVTNDLALGAGGYGTLLAAWSCGLLLGPLLIRFVPDGENPDTAAILAVTFAVLHVISFGAAAGLSLGPTTYLLFVFGGIGNALQNTYMRAVVLTAAPARTRGSVVAAYIAVLQTGSVVGMLAAAFVPATAARPGLIVASILATMISLLVLCVMVPRRGNLDAA